MIHLSLTLTVTLLISPILSKVTHFLPTIMVPAKQGLLNSLICVHGFQGHRIQSWTHPQSNLCWIRDLLPHEIQKARIHSYGYNANLFSISEQLPDVTHTGLAQELMRAIDNLRAGQNRSQVPIVFMGHSLGGLIIKEASHACCTIECGIR
jgi:predicted alpha/beta-fold hydrolase